MTKICEGVDLHNHTSTPDSLKHIQTTHFIIARSEHTGRGQSSKSCGFVEVLQIHYK